MVQVKKTLYSLTGDKKSLKDVGKDFFFQGLVQDSFLDVSKPRLGIQIIDTFSLLQCSDRLYFSI